MLLEGGGRGEGCGNDFDEDAHVLADPFGGLLEGLFMGGGQLGVILGDVSEEDGQEVLKVLGGFEAVPGGL